MTRIIQTTVVNAETNARTRPISEEPAVAGGVPGPVIPVQLPAGKPLVGGHLAAVAGLIAVLLPILSPMLPPPFGGLAVVLAFVAAFLAGVPLQMPELLAGKPVVALTAVPALGTLVPVLVEVSKAVQGPASTVVYAAALLCAWLAGVAIKAPMK